MNPLKVFKWWEKEEAERLDDVDVGAETADQDVDDDPIQGTTPPSLPPPSPPFPSQTMSSSQPMIMSGMMPMVSGWQMGLPEEKQPDPEEIGNRMAANIDRFTSKELGELILNFNKQLCGISEQSFTRSGWSCYEALVRLFEEMTAYQDD